MNIAPAKEQFAEAISKIDKLSPAPRILSRALGLLRDPDSEIGDIVALINNDPALTADIIRGSNTAYYGIGERVASLDRAVQKIGFRESIRLLNLAVIHLISARDLGSYGIGADDSWSESLFQGFFMENLARETRGHEPDEAYTAGLLRYIGRLAINQVIHDLGGGTFWDGTIPLETWEIENAGMPHTTAGAQLLRTWKFAEPMCAAIEWQNTPDAAPEGQWLAAALHFVSALFPSSASILTAIHDRQYEIAELPELPLVQRHALPPIRVQEILIETRESFAAIRRGLF